MSAVDRFRGYFVSSINNFDTKDNWVFLMGLIEAENEAQAIKRANKLVQRLSGQPLPQTKESGEEWACIYSLPGEYFAMAITSDDMPLSTKAMMYFAQ